MGVKTTDYSAQVVSKIKSRNVYTLYLFSQQTKKDALLKTPYDPKDFQHLRNEVTATSKQVSYGATCELAWNMPYAAYQERGMRADGTHRVKHYTTPGTGPWYAKNSVERNMNKMQQYINQAAGSIQ